MLLEIKIAQQRIHINSLQNNHEYDEQKNSCCGGRGLLSGYGRDLYPGSMYDAAETYYNLCAHCKSVISYSY